MRLALALALLILTGPVDAASTAGNEGPGRCVALVQNGTPNVWIVDTRHGCGPGVPTASQ